jgi:LysM repeat protein
MFPSCLLKKLFFTLPALFSLSAFAFHVTPFDSIGVEKRGDKILILHKVTAGENLTKIAKRYKTSISEIVKENELPEQKVKVDQIIKVPFTIAQSIAKTSIKNEAPKNTEAPTHVVKPGEGLFGIAKKYKVTIADIKKWNNLENETIKEGQVLIVGEGTTKKPENKKVEDEKKSPSETKKADPKTELIADPQTNANGQKIHIVKAGEGLFRISQNYKVSQENIRKWNNLDSDELSIGQELILEEPKEKELAVKKDVENTTTKPVTKETEKKNPVADAKPDKKDVVPEIKPEKKPDEKKPDETTTKVDEKPEKNPNNYIIKTETGYPKVVQTGMAEVIDEPQSEGFLALHKSAPVGTIVQVKNLTNDLSVFVKVIGKLPDTGANDKLIVKISKRAYDRLGAIDKRFRTEVSYLPQ